MTEPLRLTHVGTFNQTTARSFRLALSLLFLALFGFVAATPGNAQISAPQSAAVSAALQTNFGSALAASTAFKPFYMTGDFNGDGAQDIVIVVLVKAGRSALPKDVRILNPFEFQGTTKFPANPTTENKLALAIIHGWKNPQASAKYL
ncbi:MAG: hypothetical protein ABI698_05015, partial [bacterium]